MMEHRDVLSELLQRLNIVPTPEDFVFAQQKKVIEDPSKQKAVCTSRRAGKSHLFAVEFWKYSERYPNTVIPYIALTRDSAKRIMWKTFEVMKEKFNLEWDMIESKLTIHNRKNNSEIFLVGADQKNFIKRLRGSKYPMVRVDEAQGFSDLLLQELVEEVIQPALADYDGDISLGGTPSPTPSGYWFDVTHGKKMGWSNHTWTLLDNPHFPNAKLYLDKMKTMKGWTDQNPTYLREWLGLWVLDYDSLVYRFNKSKNVYSKLPEFVDWNRVMAVDFGWNDQTAFAIVCYSPNHPHVFIEHIEGHSELIPSMIAERAKQLIREYDPIKIIGDTGGLGKSICEEMIRRHSIHITPADKREKQTNIRMMNGDFIDGRLFVHESLHHLHQQYEKLIKSDNGLENPSLPNDLCDAALYAYKFCRGYAYQPKLPAANNSSQEYMDELESKESENLFDPDAWIRGD